MEDQQSSWNLKYWFNKFSRLIPAFMILSGVLFEVLSIFNVLSASVTENIIVGLLILIAFDSLVERVTVLERIESGLSNLHADKLKRRSQLPLLDDMTKGASEITLLAVSGIVIQSHFSLFESLLKGGCKVRALLLNPESSSLATWDQTIKGPTTISDIKTSKTLLEELAKRGSCEVRFSDIFLPFSLLIVNPNKNGEMILEFHAYRAQRPHIQLNQLYDGYWFNYFLAQFDEAWDQATPSIPTAQE